jgi:exodeoxyribonuclease VII large subunit
LRPALLETRVVRAGERLQALARLQRSLSPDAPLTRGYARVSAPGRALVPSRAVAEGEPRLTLHFHDGELEVATGRSPSAVRRRASPASDQPKLL